MKRTKWIIAIAAILALPIATAPALAAPAKQHGIVKLTKPFKTVRSKVGANCQAFVRPTFYDGDWTWQAVLDNCTQVSGVKFQNVASGQVYMVDMRNGAVHFSYAGGGDTFLTAAPQYRSTPYRNIVWYPSGCGSPAFHIYKASAFKIRNANGNTWSPNWVVFYGPAELIC